MGEDAISSWSRDLRSDSDGGMTLIELLVAMGLFTILLGVFMSGIAAMTSVTVRSQAAADSSDEVRRAYQRLDKQLRYASAVNRPGVVNGRQYIEFRNPSDDVSASPTCTQYRLNGAADTLEFRTWLDEAGASASSWTVVASRVKNNPTTEPAFVFLGTDGDHNKQRVTVYLNVENPQGDGAELRSTFVALNTTSTTVTTEADAFGNSKYPVCQQVSRV